MYDFRRITRADYPMLRGWLAQPHIGGWWGPPDKEIALIEQEVDGGDCQMFIVLTGGVPFAYVQDWCPHLAGVPHFADAPRGARAVDTFLGDPAYLGRGHAAGYLRAYAQRLLAAGAPSVVIDPSPDNPRACAAYRAAGFTDGPIRPCEDGSDVICMEFSGQTP